MVWASPHGAGPLSLVCTRKKRDDVIATAGPPPGARSSIPRETLLQPFLDCRGVTHQANVVARSPDVPHRLTAGLPTQRNAPGDLRSILGRGLETRAQRGSILGRGRETTAVNIFGSRKSLGKPEFRLVFSPLFLGEDPRRNSSEIVGPFVSSCFPRHLKMFTAVVWRPAPNEDQFSGGVWRAAPNTVYRGGVGRPAPNTVYRGGVGRPARLARYYRGGVERPRPQHLVYRGRDEETRAQKRTQDRGFLNWDGGLRQGRLNGELPEILRRQIREFAPL